MAKKTIGNSVLAMFKKPVTATNDLPPMLSEALIRAAIEKDSPLEVMRELIAMKEKEEAIAAKKEFFVAMADFQRECPIIEKKKPVKDKYGKYRYSYAPLEDIVEQVKGQLARNGFSYNIQTENLPDAVRARCPVHHIGGHTEENEPGIIMPIDYEAYMTLQQKIKSAQTFASRVVFNNAFGIMTGDPDADGAIPGDEWPPKDTAYQKKQGFRPSVPTDGQAPGKKPLPSEPKQPEQLKEKTAREVLREVAAILTENVFTDDERKKAKLELTKLAGENNIAGLEALGESWRADKTRREQETEILAEKGFENINNTLDGAIGEDNG